MLSLGIIPWIIWLKIHDKKYSGDLIRAGLFMTTLSLILDSIGVQLGLWIYPYDVIPFIPGYLPWDLTLIPITVMLMIESKPAWSPLLKSIIFAVLSAGAGEHLAIFLKIYHPIHWKPIYSIPIYIFLFLISNKLAKSKIFNSNFNSNF
ncbi:CBO0543 family protein [Cytobacillus oceanisediminis]|uniref:CBO0543 family protein n=1 Tax=Cytobacillus oceanisediminis TaxID=665099 RepID=UPI0037351F2B